MANFKSLSEDELKKTLCGYVDTADLKGLLAFVDYVTTNLESIPEDSHTRLIAGARAFTEHACEHMEQVKDMKELEKLLDVLVNAGDALVRRTAEAARSHARFKTLLLSCNVHAREMMQLAYELQGRDQEAMRILAEMPLDSGLPSASDKYKFSLWVTLADMNLKLGNEVQAENWVNTARPLERSEEIDQSVRDQFSFSYANVLDCNRKYVEAATRFFLVSATLPPESALTALTRATVCAMMAEPSPGRNRTLGALYRDDRRAKLGIVGDVIEKLFHQCVLRKHDIDALMPELQQHHKATGVDGKTTAFDLAVVRHNVLSASKIYASITFRELAALLGTSADEAESITAQMAAQGRISATIDQLNEVVSFVGNAAVPVLRWDSQIDTVGNLVASIAETIVKRHPELEPKGGL